MNNTNKIYIAFLRGINVGGHHKVPMLNLKVELEKLGFKEVVTLLNSGNIIFESSLADPSNIEKILSEHLEKSFGFPIPTLIRRSESILELYNNNPFKNINVTKDIRLYVSFLLNDIDSNLQLPWTSEDKSFHIIQKADKAVLSVLDVSVAKTTKAMGIVENNYGKDITTRNWNTIARIGKKLTDKT